jgi:hypothetical protein
MKYKIKRISFKYQYRITSFEFQLLGIKKININHSNDFIFYIYILGFRLVLSFTSYT